MMQRDKEYNDAVDKLILYAKHYYDLDDPIASDAEYDSLYSEVKEYERLHPHIAREDSPTYIVGGGVIKSFVKNTHKRRMWSLDNVFDYKGLLEWIDKLSNSLKKTTYSSHIIENLFFCISPKYDGMSLNLLYKDGLLQSATTRGNGIQGELVTQNARMIKSIPQEIAFKGEIEIRGEVVMSKEAFDMLNENSKEKSFANPRNAVAGSMRQLDSILVKERNLDFVAWGIGYCDSVSLESYMHSLGTDVTNMHGDLFYILELVYKIGFNIPYIRRVRLDGIENCYKEILQAREDFAFLLDGCVIVLCDVGMQEALGFTQKAPRFACAFKFPATETTIQILDIVAQVGRTGIITPVALFEKTLLDGANINRATLHNYEEIKRKDIRIGDHCLLVRSGDVIPKVTKVLPGRRNGSERIIQKPADCPVCKQKLVYEDIFIYCNNASCEGKIKAGLYHFVSKKCMNIEGLGDKIIDILVDLGLITTCVDIYKLTMDDLLKLEGFKEKKARNIILAINDTRENRDFWRFIHALGILHIGEVASRKLSIFGLSVFNLSLDEIMHIDGFGEQMARSFYDFCLQQADFIKNLLEFIHPILPTITNNDNLAMRDNRFSNKICVITGSFDIPRDRIKERLEQLGAKVNTSISSKTDILIVGENAGEKLQKAQSLGIEILSKEGILDILDS